MDEISVFVSEIFPDDFEKVCKGHLCDTVINYMKLSDYAVRGATLIAVNG